VSGARGFRLGAPRRTRRPSLTPMIDAVFLLLVFFMLASRFGRAGAVALVGAGDGAGAPWSGPPRLAEVAPGGRCVSTALRRRPSRPRRRP
jgi:biopolymer transport protein ExbD